ncbi:MAG: hypothetical protein Q7S50_00630 [bacterium]|nr:hypothetical protein [bacterium]
MKMSKWKEKPAMTAKDALLERIEQWKRASVTHVVNDLYLTIGKKVSDRLQTSLMTSKFSAVWIDPILAFIESSAKQLYESGSTADDLNANLIAEVAALRFESLEFEARIRTLERARSRTEK